METVQLRCGHCNNVMAISVAHLGGQVRCPHCQSVVQTPPRQPAPVPSIEPIPRLGPGEQESIFTPQEPSDDLFGGGPTQPLVEMPPEPPSHAVQAEAP